MIDLMTEKTTEPKIETTTAEKYKLQAKDVNVFYGDFQAIKNVSRVV